MIPKFPNFKLLEFSDREQINLLVSKFPPYSDYNFVSMWSWNIQNRMQLSDLEGNLVVKFTDYLTDEPFYSFIGTKKVVETVGILLDRSAAEELKPELSLIPECVARTLPENKFQIYEDKDNFDYIYDLSKLKDYAGSQFSGKRNKLKIFIKLYPGALVKVIDLNNPKIQKEVMSLDKFWLKNKLEKDLNFKVKNELIATQRFLQASFKDALGIGLFSGNKMIGYSILGLVPNSKYCVSHFCKADTTYHGIYEFLIKESANILIKKGFHYLNYEQDLGLPGLRENKRSFMSNYLKKYIVSF